jgi:hypothetical protein
MIEDLTIRNLSPATQRSYIHAVAKFSRFLDARPDLLGCEDVRAYQLHLVSQQISWGSLNQTVCAPRLTKTGTIASPWRYDGGADRAPWSPSRKRQIDPILFPDAG